jgi:hypothetical protein
MYMDANLERSHVSGYHFMSKSELDGSASFENIRPGQ